MWVLLSGGLRRWVIFSVAVPVAARILSRAGPELERSRGRSRRSRGLRSAGALASSGKAKQRARAATHRR